MFLIRFIVNVLAEAQKSLAASDLRDLFSCEERTLGTFRVPDR